MNADDSWRSTSSGTPVEGRSSSSARLRSASAAHKSETSPSSDYWYLALNENKAPWDDVRVRQAIAYAIDRDAIVQATSYGTAQENQLAIPEDSVWFTGYDTYSTDLDKALVNAGEDL